MQIKSLATELNTNTYPGRGIVLGKSKDGKKAVIAYFIMGRSANSRNRIFEENDRGGIRTKAFDESKMEDPSLIIYNPVLKIDGKTIVTNGDQTDTIYDYIKSGSTFEEALFTREFEPDAPNYTPRISGVNFYDCENASFEYTLSILKSGDGDPSVCNRFFYNYSPVAGKGHFIHTYKCDGDPIPSFEGEPEAVELPDTAKELADTVWENLNEQNKVSLFVRSVELSSGETEEIIINKNK